MGVRQMYTVRFAAPELLMDTAGFPHRVRSKTRPSDVYAFGMLILEHWHWNRQAFTERPPWPELNEFAVMHRVCCGLRPPRPDGMAMIHGWWAVCEKCWRTAPAARPSMQHVVGELLVGEWPRASD
ncbi:hypothetical protein AURDEDRAFT_174077 [Auricularia subglabra TFB-10046 SS5]|nr:hypothetical protein AURDEDRAFT_174077 [Auricularia subglabra TFB-10046 SS5]